MALAETARLIATYEVQDKSAQGIRSATTGLTGLQGKAATFATTLRTHVGGALTTFGGRLRQIGGLAAASLGVTGLFGFVGALKESIDFARDFGAEVIKMGKLTGLSTEQASALASALHHYGIESAQAIRLTGMAEKNVGNLTKTNAAAVKYQKDYGFSLLDSSGHVKDFNTLLLDTADFFNNKSIPAQTKAAGIAKIFGRSWQDLIPVLSAGRQGIQDAEDEARRLGLTLTDENIKQLKESREATREWGTALGGLKLQIGLVVLPALTDLAKAATAFVSSHRGDIVAFFKNVITTGRNVAGTIGGLVSTISDFWNKIPAPMRDLLVKGIVAERTVKFLFGISPIQIVTSLAGGALEGIGKGLFGGLFQRGSTPANPMWVAPVGGGLGGGPGGVAGGGGLGLLGLLGLAGAAVTAAHDAPILFDATKSGIGAIQNRDAGGLLQSLRSIATDMLAIPQFIKDLATGEFDKAATEIGKAQSDAAVKEAGSEKGRADDKRESNRISAQAGTRPLIDKLEKQHADLTKIRDVNEKNRIATVTGLNRTTAATREGLAQTRRQLTAAQQGAANRMTAAQHNAADRIVRAIYATRNVSVNVTLAQRGGAAAVASALFIGRKPVPTG